MRIYVWLEIEGIGCNFFTKWNYPVLPRIGEAISTGVYSLLKNSDDDPEVKIFTETPISELGISDSYSLYNTFLEYFSESGNQLIIKNIDWSANAETGEIYPWIWIDDTI